MIFQWILIIGLPVLALFFSIRYVIQEKDLILGFLPILAAVGTFLVAVLISYGISYIGGAALQNKWNTEVYSTETVQLVSIVEDKSLIISLQNNGDEKYYYGVPTDNGTLISHVTGANIITIHTTAEDEKESLVIEHLRFKNPFMRFFFVAPDRNSFYINNKEVLGNIISNEKF